MQKTGAGGLLPHRHHLEHSLFQEGIQGMLWHLVAGHLQGSSIQASLQSSAEQLLPVASTCLNHGIPTAWSLTLRHDTSHTDASTV